MDNITEKYNLLNFLQKYNVKIPILQRDYVQGRIGEENVRNSFLFKLYEFIINKDGRKLNLDFIFGYQENNIFYPIDGQQRITTLWLLHLYLYGKQEQALNKEIKNALKNFSYSVRNISSNFCNLLVRNLLNFNEMPENILSRMLIYSGDMKLDPTVKSMVKMLNSIHEKFNNIKFINDATERLNDIVFSVIDMKQFKLGESLYIKLNGRGRQLSVYENFKAWIMEDNDIRREYASILNTYWIDKFWNIRNQYDTDIYLMKFINICTLYFKYNEGYDKITINLKDEPIKTLDKSIYLKKEHNNPNEHIFTIQYISLMDKAINFIADNNFDIYNLKEIDVFIVLSYFEQNSTIDINKFNDYYGVISRIYNNVRFEYEYDAIYNIHGLIKEWKIYSNNIILKLSELEITNNKSGNFASNKEEEIIKAKLIQKSRQEGNGWETAINKAHEHKYFNGRIMFLLNYSKQNNEYLLEEFKIYYEIVGKIFEHDFFSSKLNLIQRSMLSLYDYTWYNSHYNLGLSNNDLRNKNQWYRYVFNDKENEEYPFKKYVDKVREQFKTNNILECLQQIIKNNSSFKNFKGDWWRYLIVKYSEVMKHSQNKKFYFDDNEKPVWILSKTRMSSTRWNLLTYGLYVFISKYIKKNNYNDIDVSEYEPSDPTNNNVIRFTINNQYSIYHNKNSNEITIKYGKSREVFEYKNKNIDSYYKNICKYCNIIK